MLSTKLFTKKLYYFQYSRAYNFITKTGLFLTQVLIALLTNTFTSNYRSIYSYVLAVSTT